MKETITKYGGKFRMNGIYRDRLEEPKKKKKQKKSGGNKKRKYAKCCLFNLQGIEISRDSVDCLLCAVARCTPSGSHMTL